MLEYKLCLSLH